VEFAAAAQRHRSKDAEPTTDIQTFCLETLYQVKAIALIVSAKLLEKLEIIFDKLSLFSTT